MIPETTLTFEEINVVPPVSAEFVDFDNDGTNQAVKNCKPRPGGGQHCT